MGGGGKDVAEDLARFDLQAGARVALSFSDTFKVPRWAPVQI